MDLTVNQAICEVYIIYKYIKAVLSSLHSKLLGDRDPSPSLVGTLVTALSLTFLSGRRIRFSERTVQSVVVVFEILQLQEVSGPLAALLHCRREVGGLGGGGGGARRLRGAGQVFGCRLVVLAWRAAAAAVRLDSRSQFG